jgi:hypothetical protein
VNLICQGRTVAYAPDRLNLACTGCSVRMPVHNALWKVAVMGKSTSKLLAGALFVGLSGAGGACQDNAVYCTLIGCNNTLAITLEANEWPSGRYTVHIQENSESITCTLAVEADAGAAGHAGARASYHGPVRATSSKTCTDYSCRTTITVRPALKRGQSMACLAASSS